MNIKHVMIVDRPLEGFLIPLREPSMDLARVSYTQLSLYPELAVCNYGW